MTHDVCLTAWNMPATTSCGMMGFTSTALRFKLKHLSWLTFEAVVA